MNLLFVCTGNTCRSPMAEALALAALRAEGGFSDWGVASAGLAAFAGDGPTPASVRVCAARGLDISAHRARALTTELVAASDHIYTMTYAQAAQLRQILPAEAARIEPLIAGADVRDPYGKGEDAYEACFLEIANAIQHRLKEWKQEKEGV